MSKPIFRLTVAASAAVLLGSASARDLSSEVYQARDLSTLQYQARDLSAERQARSASSSAQSQSFQGSESGVGALLGAWQTNVGGGVWTTPSAIPGWDTLHISAGALAGILVLYPDHTYVWNAYGGKKGRWAESGREDYPINLDDPAERRVWQVGLDERNPGRIYVKDTKGFYYYQGKRAN